MFTGIIEVLGSVQRIESRPPGVRLVVQAAALAEGAGIGDSIAINGCCLTVVEVNRESESENKNKNTCLGFDAGEETLSRTNLGRLQPGSVVNLERSLELGDRLGGHLVTGHIDAVGTLDARVDEGDWSKFWFRVPRELTRQMASKGSVAVDGISLTLVDVEPERFSVALIPHTLNVTTLGPLQQGDEVNLETDVLAKYVQRQLEWREDEGDDGGG